MSREYPPSTTVSQPVSLIWHFAQPPGTERPVISEVQSSWDELEGLPLAERQAAISQRLKAAAAGRLILDEELVEVRRDPDLWEVRWNLRETMFRLYYAEPAGFPGVLLALRFHEKLNLGTASATRAAQDREIDVATHRYMMWRPRWGM